LLNTSSDETSVGSIKTCSVRLQRLSDGDCVDTQQSTGDDDASHTELVKGGHEAPSELDKISTESHTSSPAKLVLCSPSSKTTPRKIRRTARKSCTTAVSGTPTRQLKLVEMLSHKSPKTDVSKTPGHQHVIEPVSRSLHLSDATSKSSVDAEVLVEDSQMPLSHVKSDSSGLDGPDIVPMCVEETPPSDSLESSESERQNSVPKRLFQPAAGSMNDAGIPSVIAEPTKGTSFVLDELPVLSNVVNESISQIADSQTAGLECGDSHGVHASDDGKNGLEEKNAETDQQANSNVTLTTQTGDSMYSHVDVMTHSVSSECPPVVAEYVQKRAGRSKKAAEVPDSGVVAISVEKGTLKTVVANVEEAAASSDSVTDDSTSEQPVKRKRGRPRKSADNLSVLAGQSDSNRNMAVKDSLEPDKLKTNDADSSQTHALPGPDCLPKAGAVDGTSNEPGACRSSRRRSAKHTSAGDPTSYVGQGSINCDAGCENAETNVSKKLSQTEGKIPVGSGCESQDSTASGRKEPDTDPEDNVPLVGILEQRDKVGRRKLKSAETTPIDTSELSSCKVEANSAAALDSQLDFCAAENVSNNLTCDNSDSNRPADISAETDPEDEIPLAGIVRPLATVTSESTAKDDVPLSQLLTRGKSRRLRSSGEPAGSDAETESDRSRASRSRSESLLKITDNLDEDDVPLTMICQPAVREQEMNAQSQLQSPETGSRRRKNRNPERSPSHHLHAIKKTLAMKANALSRSNKLNLRSRAVRQKTSEKLMEEKSAGHHVVYRQKKELQKQHQSSVLKKREVGEVKDDEMEVHQHTEPTAACHGLSENVASDSGNDSANNNHALTGDPVKELRTAGDDQDSATNKVHAKSVTETEVDVIVIVDSQDVGQSDAEHHTETSLCALGSTDVVPKINAECDVPHMQSPAMNVDDEVIGASVGSKIECSASAPVDELMTVHENDDQASDEVTGVSDGSVVSDGVNIGSAKSVQPLESVAELLTGESGTTTHSSVSRTDDIRSCEQSDAVDTFANSEDVSTLNAAAIASPERDQTPGAAKFIMPADKLSVPNGIGDAPPETPTSASRNAFASRGSLMLQRAKQMQKVGSVSSSRLLDDGSPTTVERPKSSFLQRVYSPSASPSAGILRKRHLNIADPSTESPSPPNKVELLFCLVVVMLNDLTS
jgi:hypothetical protein